MHHAPHIAALVVTAITVVAVAGCSDRDASSPEEVDQLAEHEMVEYLPSLVEWKVTAGIWALGLMVFTVALKIALPVFTGKVTVDRESATGGR